MANSPNSYQSSLSVTDIVVSCSICQDTLSRIYAEDDGNLGLRNSDKPYSGRITKLWLTECAHLTCGKHLEGGGAPFHADNEVPRAPCPLCTLEKNDPSEKSLFFVNGISKGEYDEHIPAGYFQTPPNGDAAQRASAAPFQYVSLLRFGLKTAEKALRSEAALHQWEGKKAEIVRSLRNVAPLRDELVHAGQRLLALGQDVSSIEALLNSLGASLGGLPTYPQHQQTHKEGRYVEKNNNPCRSPLDVESRLAQGSAADLKALSKDKDPSLSSGYVPFTQNGLVAQYGSSSKTKRAGTSSEVEQMDYVLGGKRYEKGRSRDLMPPPPIPMQQECAFMAKIPTQEISPQNGYGGRSQTGTVPATPYYQRVSRKSSSQFEHPRSSPQPAPSVAANNGGNRSPRGCDLPSRIPAASQERDLSSGVAGYHGASDLNLLREPSSVHAIGNIACRYSQPYKDGNFQVPLELNNRPKHTNCHNYRSPSRLGLSVNARSSGRQTIQSSSNSEPRRSRQPLGQVVSASPHFLPRRLSNGISMSSLRGQQCTNMSRPNSYSSSTTTLVGSRERDNLVMTPDNFAESDRGRKYLTDLGIATSDRVDPYHGRLSTTDAETSAKRRRANR